MDLPFAVILLLQIVSENTCKDPTSFPPYFLLVLHNLSVYVLPKFFTFPIEIHILALMNVVSYTAIAWEFYFC